MGRLRLREKVRPTAANINLTKPQLLNREGGQVARHAATNISAKATPLQNKTVKYKQQNGLYRFGASFGVILLGSFRLVASSQTFDPSTSLLEPIPPPSPTIWLIPTFLVHPSSLKRPRSGVGLTQCRPILLMSLTSIPSLSSSMTRRSLCQT